MESKMLKNNHYWVKFLCHHIFDQFWRVFIYGIFGIEKKIGDALFSTLTVFHLEQVVTVACFCSSSALVIILFIAVITTFTIYTEHYNTLIPEHLFETICIWNLRKKFQIKFPISISKRCNVLKLNLFEPTILAEKNSAYAFF